MTGPSEIQRLSGISYRGLIKAMAAFGIACAATIRRQTSIVGLALSLQAAIDFILEISRGRILWKVS